MMAGDANDQHAEKLSLRKCRLRDPFAEINYTAACLLATIVGIGIAMGDYWYYLLGYVPVVTAALLVAAGFLRRQIHIAFTLILALLVTLVLAAALFVAFFVTCLESLHFGGPL